MNSSFSIKLPHNFQFINRLPARFKMLVVQVQNHTDKGTWYKVEIDKQQLHILSRRSLQAGEQYLIEKKSSLELNVVEKIKLLSKEKESKQVARSETNLESNRQQVLQNSESLPVFMAHLLSLLYVSQKSSQKEQSISAINPNSFYFQKKIDTSEVAGVFKKMDQGWLLYLSLPLPLQAETDIAKKIHLALFGLPIENVFLVEKESLPSLAGGIDILS